MHARKILLIGIGASFVLLCALVLRSLRPEQTRQWAAYSPALVKKSWQSHAYLPLQPLEPVRAALQKQTEEVTRSSATLSERAGQLLDLQVGFLKAYSSGNFEDFWRFRVPTGTSRDNPDKVAFLKGILNDVQRALKSAGIALPPSEMMTPEGAQGETRFLLSELWKYDDALRERRARTPEKNRVSAITFCTKCLAEVSVETLEIAEYPAMRKLPDIQATLASRENIGVVVHSGGVEIEPAPFAPAGTATDFVSVGLNIKTDFGFCHPVFILAYWHAATAKYIPIMMALPNSSRERAFMHF